VEVTADDGDVLGLVDDRLVTFRAGPGAAASSASFRFHDRADGLAIPLPPGQGRPVYDLPVGQVVYFDDEDLLFVEHGGVAMAAALRQGVVDTWVVAGDRARWLASHPFFTIGLLELLKRQGLFSLHAAGCSAGGGKVVLLAGPSGAGKSTLALALTRAGFGLLGDDTLFLGRDAGDVGVLGFPDEVDVTDATTGLLPELGYLLGRPKPPGALKHRLRAEEVFGQPVSTGRATALVFPEVTSAVGSVLTPMAEEEALLRLAPDVLLTERTASQAHLDALGRLAGNCPAYRLETGRDLNRVVYLVRDLFAE